MPLIKLYSTPVLLLLMLTCSRVSQSVPVMGKGPLTESCVSYAQMLLQNITDTLTQNKLFNIDCTVKLNPETNTPSVCAPKESTCSGTVKSEFDQELCLTNIGKDLQYYHKFLAAQPDPDSLLGPTVLFRLREFMENCFTYQPTDLAPKEAATERPSSFDQRLRLCKELKGFQVRSITINRAMSYMSSGEHTK